MPITESVKEQVEEMAIEDGATKGLSFKNRKGIEFKFDNDKEYEMLVEPEDPAPYPDIPVNAPGEEFGVDDVVQEKSEQMVKEWAMLGAENSGLDFSLVSTKVMGGEMIKILDDDEEEAINKYIWKEILMKVELNWEEKMLQDVVQTAKGEEPRRSACAQIANRQYKDNQLYVTAEEEELILATVGNKHDEEDNAEKVLATVAHYVMTHYAEKEVTKKKKKHKPKSGQYQLEAGIKRLRKKGEMEVTKELNQFNNKVFMPQHANDLSEEDKKKALSSLIFIRKKGQRHQG